MQDNFQIFLSDIGCTVYFYKLCIGIVKLYPLRIGQTVIKYINQAPGFEKPDAWDIQIFYYFAIL